MTVRKLSKILMLSGSIGMFTGIACMTCNPEPEKPLPLTIPNIEQGIGRVQYEKIKSHYAQQIYQQSKEIMYTTGFSLLSIIVFGIGLHRDQKAITDYLESKKQG